MQPRIGKQNGMQTPGSVVPTSKSLLQAPANDALRLSALPPKRQFDVETFRLTGY
jgi:hypothetical protein